MSEGIDLDGITGIARATNQVSGNLEKILTRGEGRSEAMAMMGHRLGKSVLPVSTAIAVNAHLNDTPEAVKDSIEAGIKVFLGAHALDYESYFTPNWTVADPNNGGAFSLVDDEFTFPVETSEIPDDWKHVQMSVGAEVKNLEADGSSPRANGNAQLYLGIAMLAPDSSHYSHVGLALSPYGVNPSTGLIEFSTSYNIALSPNNSEYKAYAFIMLVDVITLDLVKAQLMGDPLKTYFRISELP